MDKTSDAVLAIELALTLDDHYEVRDFLSGWLRCDPGEWESAFEAFKRNASLAEREKEARL